MTDLWKRSTESRLFNFDFSQNNLMPTGVVLASASVAQTNLNRASGSSDLDLHGGGAAVSGQLAQLEIGGGTDGEVYQLIATGLDASARVYPLVGFMDVSNSKTGSALIVGTDAYIDLAWADSYFAGTRKVAWETANTLEEEAAIRQATQFIDASYEFKECVTSGTQLLSWPRTGVIDGQGRLLDSAAIPRVVQEATAELALEALSGALLAPSVSKTGAIRRAKSGDDEVEYFAGTSATGQRTFTLVNRLLSSVTRPSNTLLRA